MEVWIVHMTVVPVGSYKGKKFPSSPVRIFRRAKRQAPKAILLQTFSHGSLPRALSIASSALVIGTLAITAFGFASGRSRS